MLHLYRRHFDECPFKNKGRECRKCSCPIHCDGIVNGRRVRQAMDTTNWDRAKRRMDALEDELKGGRISKGLAEAASAFLPSIDADVEDATRTKYTRIMNRLIEFGSGRGIATVEAFRLEDLDKLPIVARAVRDEMVQGTSATPDLLHLLY